MGFLGEISKGAKFVPGPGKVGDTSWHVGL